MVPLRAQLIVVGYWRNLRCKMYTNDRTCDCKGSMQVVPPAVKLQNTFTASQAQPWLGST